MASFPASEDPVAILRGVMAGGSGIQIQREWQSSEVVDLA